MDDDAPALTAEPAPPPVPASPPAVEDSVRVIVAVEQRSVWRAGTIVIALASLAAFGWFVLDDGGSVFFTLLIAWFASIAMEPAVGRLARRMRRGAATGLVMLAVGVFTVVFAVLFGKLIADQLVQAVKAVPALSAAALDWVNQHFGTEYSQTDALSAVGITQDTLTTWAKELAGGVLGLIVSVLGAFFSTFTFLLFTFYFSADAPRFKRYIAQLFTPRWQPVVVNVWTSPSRRPAGTCRRASSWPPSTARPPRCSCSSSACRTG